MGKRQQAQIEALEADVHRLRQAYDKVRAERDGYAAALNRADAELSLVDVARREWGQMVDRVVDWSGFGG